MMGFDTASRCFATQGPIAAAIFAESAALEMTVAASWSRRLGTIAWRSASTPSHSVSGVHRQIHKVAEVIGEQYA